MQVAKAKEEARVPSPNKELGVIDPLVYEVSRDGLRAVLNVYAVQGFNEQDRVVVQSSDSHLQTHGPQFATLHPPHQPLHDQLHEQRHTLRGDTVGGQLKHTRGDRWTGENSWTWLS